MIKIERMKPHHLEQVTTLEVAEDQLKYVGTLEEILVNVSDACHPHVVIANNEIVGFFLLDIEYPENYDFCAVNSVGLRAFLISNKYQGKGYGKGATLALRPYLKANIPKYQYIYLTVNCKNVAAYRCYLSANFEDTKALYLGGAAGPQHIMRLKIT